MKSDFEKYPYYIYPAIQALTEATGEERTELLRRIAVGVGPESALRTLLDVDPEEFRDFYGTLEQPDLTTDDTISEFIGRFGAGQQSGAAPIPEEIPIAAPAIDYASMMLDDGEDRNMADDPTSDLLNSFLGGGAKPEAQTEPEDISDRQEQTDAEPEPESVQEPEVTPEPDKIPSSEVALVKIMIKKGNYRKALEIITDLNLNNPKKSIYFADQMRFLQKLIDLQDKNHIAK